MLWPMQDMRQRILEHHWSVFSDTGLSETSSMEWRRHWPTLTLAALFQLQRVSSLSTASPGWPACWHIVSASVHLRGQLSWPACWHIVSASVHLSLSLRGQLSWPAWLLTAEFEIERDEGPRQLSKRGGDTGQHWSQEGWGYTRGSLLCHGCKKWN